MVVNKTLLNLTAADLMTQGIVVVPQEMSLEGAAHLLSQAHVTGAPVTDAAGRCVGVLSATDFIHWAEKGARPGASPAASVCSAWQIVEHAECKETVSRHMTADPVTVRPGVRIGELARMMLDAHIHRVIVVDPDERPIGIVSSTDLLAAIAQAAQSTEAAHPGLKEPVAVG